MTRLRGGFTLVELIVVIATIGILTTIATIGLTRYQADTRDARRASSATVIAEALEKYYQKNGEYPSCTAIQQSISVVAQDILGGIQPSSLTVPGAANGTNSLKCSNLSINSSPDFFQYLGDGSSTCNTGSCIYFAIRYKDEASGTIKSITSRQTPDIDEPTNLVATINSSTQVTLSWTASPNAASYVVSRSTADDFPVGASTTEYASQVPTSKIFTDEAAGVTHYYRVKALSGGHESRWSDIASATPPPVAPTSLLIANTSATSQHLSWTASASATSYRIRKADNPSFTSPTDSNVTPATFDATPLNQGARYYYRVYSVTNSVLSDTYISGNEITAINNPASYAITSSSDSATLYATSNAICPANATGYYVWTANGSAWQQGSGASYKSVSYTPSINGSVTLAVSSRCYTIDIADGTTQVTSGLVAATNTVSYTRTVPTPSFTVFQANGSRVWAQWTNVCGGTYQLHLRQGGYQETTAPHWNASGNPWTSSGVVTMPSSNNDTRSWASNGNRFYQVMANCGGVWGSYSGEIGPI